MEDCPYTGCAQNKERKQNSANTPLQWLDWPQATAKIVIQSVSDTAEKKTFSGRENRAWPAWSLVTRWTEPARSWGCASSKSDVYRSGGGASGRLVTLEQGLAWSKNTVSAHLINKIGPQDVIDLAQDMGVSSPMMPVPSLALGTSETSLLEMVNAYATIADYGVRRNVTAITSISDKEGHIVATFPSEPDRVLSEQTSYTMINMLRKAVDQGTGGWLRTRFGIQGDVAGKTDTTQNNADGWFVAMHPDAVVGAWVGFNDQRVTFMSDYWGQGGHNALLLVGDFLQSGSKGPAAYISSSEFKRPAAYQNPKKPLYTAPPKHIDLAAIGGELREPFEDESFTAPARSPQSISTFTRRARIRTLSTPPDRGQ